MSKKINFLLSAVTLSAVVTPVVAFADGGGTTGTTNATVTFNQGSGGVVPVDPNNPTNPVTPTPDNTQNGADTKNTGPLQLVYVPAKWDFSTQKISTSDAQYPLSTAGTSATTLLKNAVSLQVSDTRGTRHGWTLSASGSSFTATNDTVNSITLSLPFGIVNSSTNANDTGATGTAQTINFDGTANSQNVLSATKGTGGGLTVYNLDPAKINLKVPANSVKSATYNAQLNWTLADAPQ